MLLDGIWYEKSGILVCSKVGDCKRILTARLKISEYESDVSLHGISDFASFTYWLLPSFIALLKSCSIT